MLYSHILHVHLWVGGSAAQTVGGIYRKRALGYHLVLCPHLVGVRPEGSTHGYFKKVVTTIEVVPQILLKN